jgi:hypothetical protein
MYIIQEMDPFFVNRLLESGQAYDCSNPPLRSDMSVSDSARPFDIAPRTCSKSVRDFDLFSSLSLTTTPTEQPNMVSHMLL